MLIRCPTCASGYDLPHHLIPHGRILRCAHCRDAWLHDAATAQAPEAARVIATEVRAARTPSPPPRRPSPSSRPERRAPRLAGSVAAGVVLFATMASGMAAVAARERIVAALPPSAAVFAAVGLPVNLRGLALSGLRSAVAVSDGGSTLTLEGTIVNLRARTTPVPSIRIAVQTADRRELYAWTMPAPRATLAAGATVPFQARLATPPGEGEILSVSFSDARPAPVRHVAEASPVAR